MNTQKKHMAAPVQAVGVTNLWAGLIGCLIFFASAQVAAEVCEAEIEQSILSANNAMPDKTHPFKSRDYYEKHVADWSSTGCSSISNIQNIIKDNERILATGIAMSRPGDLRAQSVVNLSKFRLCVLRATAARCNSQTTSAPPSSVAASTNRTPSMNPATANSQAAGVAGFSRQQISVCSEEIKRKQIESQSWGGDANDVAARLGQFQKNLFEGKCSGHPEAQAYIAGANKMMGYSANAGSGSSLPPLASTGGTGSSGSPDPSRSRKVHNPAADAKGCSKLIPSTEWIGKSAMGGNFRFVNDCPTKVEFFWCSDNECTRDSGNTWTISAGGNWPVSGTNVRWGACRGRDSGGFDKGSQGQRYTCPNLTW